MAGIWVFGVSLGRWGNKQEMIRVLSILGTRPEAVKMAPVIQALEQHSFIDSYVCVTAQHRLMLDQVLSLFNIKPDFDLDLMQENQSLTDLTANILIHLEKVLGQINPDWILVQGDTTTAMTASLLAYYNRIHLGHVEAGLRTGDKWQPFPEEVNRRMISVIADINFVPTEHSRQNLLREGVPEWRITCTGNTVIDALRVIESQPVPEETTRILERIGILRDKKQLILVTAHRRENFGKPIENICHALRDIAEKYSSTIEMVYPVHLNPNIREPVHRLLDKVENITLLEPVAYLTMVHLMRKAKLVLTDSGGIQEEATALNIPTLVLRDVTERPEGVEAGVLKVVGSDSDCIVHETSRLLDDAEAYLKMSHAENPFGDGHAAERIVHELVDFDKKL